MKFGALLATLALLALPVGALAADPELQISKPAVVDGKSVPIHATLSATSSDVVLSSAKTDGAVPVTITVYVSPKPKPKPAATSSTQSAAAIESSQGIQSAVAGVSPGAAQAVAPFFTLVDGGRQAAADTLGGQLANTKEALGSDASNPGQVLSAESTKSASQDPMGTFWLVLQTIYLYVLTALLFLVSNAGVFYPVLAALFLYALWRIVKYFRRPKY